MSSPAVRLESFVRGAAGSPGSTSSAIVSPAAPGEKAHEVFRVRPCRVVAHVRLAAIFEGCGQTAARNGGLRAEALGEFAPCAAHGVIERTPARILRQQRNARAGVAQQILARAPVLDGPAEIEIQHRLGVAVEIEHDGCIRRAFDDGAF